MSPKLALQIGAVLATIFGLALALLPAQMLAGFGLATPSDALVVSRDLGVTLLGLAVINWLARDATGAALRAVLAGKGMIQALEFVANGLEVLAGALPAQAAGGVILHLARGVVFGLALGRV